MKKKQPVLKKSSFHKLLLVMKMTVILLLFFMLQVSAKGYSQEKITLAVKKTEISNILSRIEKNTHYRFLYNNNLVGLKAKVTLSVEDADLRQVLDQLLINTGLTYQITETDLIVIREIGDAGKPEVQNLITGTVSDENGLPISGVSVQVKGTLKGTITNDKGNFSINALTTDLLIFSYVGYETKEMAVSGKNEINIILLLSKKELDQVIVIGYGTQKKRDLTGSISVIKGEDIAKMPSTNPIASLQGKVAGLTIVNSGQAGSSPTVRIRGVNSTNNADPLYVVDGILQTNIDYLNQADIESIEILKDPSSISIYGLQGGNGVIIITTKRAKKGTTNINFQSNVGIQKVIHKIDVVDAAGFQKLYSKQIENVIQNGGTATPFDFTNYKGNTDWQDQIYRSAIISSSSLSISNSAEKSNTYLNIGYSTQEGVEKFDKYERYIIRLNEEIKVTNNIRVGASIGGFYYKQNPAAGGIENEAIWAAPVVPVQAGQGLYYSMPSFQRAQVANPVSIVDASNGHNLNSGYRLNGNIFAEIKFLKNFTWKTSFYADLSFNQTRGYSPLPFRYINLDVTDGIGGIDTSYVVHAPFTGVSQSEANYKTYQQDHTLVFDKNFKSGHHLTALAGFSTLYRYNDFLNANRTDTTLDIPDNPIFWYVNIANASNPGNFFGGGDENASVSFFGRINYSFKSRYLLNLAYRRDGTSKVSAQNRWGNFGSIGAGWVISDEPFMKNIKWLDFLKLKASWGTVGNGLNINSYLYYPILSVGNVGVFGNNLYPAIVTNIIPDPNLHWETVEGKDAGFESRMLKNRLSLDVDFYDRKTHDILTYITIPNQSKLFFTNLGTIDNKGIEITAGWKDKISKELHYSINGNFSINKNLVESIGNSFDFEITRGNNLTRSGYSIGYFYGYVQTGIYQTEEEIAKSPYFKDAKPGDIIYKDLDGNDTINTKDRTYLGSPFPKFNFGLSISFAYKGFDFGIEVQGVAGNKIYAERRTYRFTTLNYESNRLDAWSKPRSTNTEPILDPARGNNYLFSTYWLESGNYLRLRTLQLGYTFNTLKSKNNGIKTLRLYISGQNIATLTKATGYSPEVPIDDPVSGGHDNGVYPLPAIYSFGLNATF